MLVCHCQGVHSREIEAAVEAGATTLSQMSEACGAGTRCGGCLPLGEEIARGALARRSQPRARQEPRDGPGARMQKVSLAVIEARAQR